jgi:photosystem II stability/assembly factor-like uncharacterized protein
MLLAVGLCSGPAVAAPVAAPVAPALERPALAVRAPEHAVLLGAALAGTRLVAVGERGIVLLSDDSGESWRQVPVPVSVTLTAVRFADEQHGFAVGHGGVVLATDDGGETWIRRLDGPQAAQLALAAAQASGDEWAVREAELLVADGPDKPLLDVLVLDARHAVVMGAYGLAFATSNGGETWTSWMERLGNRSGMHLYTVRRRGERILVAGEQGLVRLSEDGGRSFVPITTPYGGSFFTAELPGENSIVVAGLRGNVWHSADNGANWTQVPVPMQASITASAVRADGALVFVNQAGMVLGERDGALVPINAATLPPLNGVVATPDDSLLALGIHGAVSVSVKSGDPK